MEWREYWLKANENLEVALLAFKRKKHNVCASLAYYAVFQASIAALIKLTELRARDNEWGHGLGAGRVKSPIDHASKSVAGRYWPNTDGLE